MAATPHRGAPLRARSIESASVAELDLEPAQTRVLSRERGWKSIIAFRTRTTPHTALEFGQETGLAFTGTQLRKTSSAGEGSPGETLRPDVTGVILAFDKQFAER